MEIPLLQPAEICIGSSYLRLNNTSQWGRKANTDKRNGQLGEENRKGENISVMDRKERYREVGEESVLPWNNETVNSRRHRRL